MGILLVKGSFLCLLINWEFYNDEVYNITVSDSFSVN